MAINSEKESQFATGYKGEMFYAVMPDQSKVSSYAWKVQLNGNVEEFFFKSEFSSVQLSWKWKTESKSTDLFEVVNNAGEAKSTISSHFRLIKKLAANTTLRLDFFMNDYTSFITCGIDNISFKSNYFKHLT